MRFSGSLVNSLNKAQNSSKKKKRYDAYGSPCYVGETRYGAYGNHACRQKTLWSLR